MIANICRVPSARKHAGDRRQETATWPSTVGLILMLALSLFAQLQATDAQQPVKVPLIGVLGDSAVQWQQSPFWPKPRELGWHEGDNIAIEGRYAEGKLDRLPDLAADLVRLGPDVIVTGGTLGVRAAQQATTTIPIVSSGTGMLVEQELVASLAHPGGNITGVETNRPELYGKRLGLLKEALPQIARVAFLSNPTSPFTHLLLPSLETDARALGVQLQPVAVRHPDEFEAAFAAIVERRPDALFIQDNILFHSYLQQIMDFATTHRLPTMSGERRFAEAGNLMAFGYSHRELAQRAAVYVDKILKGARPGDLPIERPVTFELMINLKTAKTLGLTIPPSILFQADEVIQ
jgi:putative tryptophan/tyrosine transport system substrate-binding protein